MINLLWCKWNTLEHKTEWLWWNRNGLCFIPWKVNMHKLRWVQGIVSGVVIFVRWRFIIWYWLWVMESFKVSWWRLWIGFELMTLITKKPYCCCDIRAASYNSRTTSTSTIPGSCLFWIKLNVSVILSRSLVWWLESNSDDVTCTCISRILNWEFDIWIC